MTEIAYVKKGTLGREPSGGSEAVATRNGQDYDHPAEVATVLIANVSPLPRLNIARGDMLILYHERSP